jgi:CheY-like chemotaxis protein
MVIYPILLLLLFLVLVLGAFLVSTFQCSWTNLVISLHPPRRTECAGPVIQKTTEKNLSSMWCSVFSARNSRTVPALPATNALAIGSRRTVCALLLCESIHSIFNAATRGGKSLFMKGHIQMSPHAPPLPTQKPPTSSINSDRSAEDRATATSSEYSPSFRPEQNPASAIADEKEDSCLIYVVDDEPGLADLYAIILRERGYVVKAFDSRIEALAQIKGDRRKPDLLIMDYFGHAMSVDRFILRCLLAHPNLRILMASGFNQINARFASVRPDRFIQKPFTAEEFLQQVEATLAA